MLQRFRPITVEKPKVLLPLVNVPLLEYTLEWLALNRVEEVCQMECVNITSNIQQVLQAV
jgi:translation initiation factor eIF-2B subunit epsilon